MPKPKPDYPFKSDGCTAFLDGCWRHCCVRHDKDYWMGGTPGERKVSDQRLRDCVDEACLQHGWKSWSAWILSRLMYVGVRAFGRLPIHEAFWGFGWERPRTGP